MSSGSGDEEKKGSGWERFFLNPAVIGLTTMAGVVAGYLGAHFDKAIACIFWACPADEKAPWGVFAFVVATILFGVFFCTSAWHQSNRADRQTNDLKDISDYINRKTDNLKDQAEQLADRVGDLFSMPPVGFLENYQEAVNNSHGSMFLTYKSAIPQESVRETAVRIQLTNIINIAQQFDQDGHNSRYGGNIMLFRSSQGMSDADATRFRHCMKFAESSTHPKFLQGVLELVSSLSVASDTSGDADLTLKEMCLPVPLFDNGAGGGASEDGEGVLPGAVEAYLSGDVAIIAGVESWNERADAGRHSGNIQRKLIDFFSESTHVKSFVSIPLFVPKIFSADECDIGVANNTKPFAVLNIHRDKENVTLPEKCEFLLPILSPFISNITQLLLARIENEDKLFGSAPAIKGVRVDAGNEGVAA